MNMQKLHLSVLARDYRARVGFRSRWKPTKIERDKAKNYASRVRRINNGTARWCKKLSLEVRLVSHYWIMWSQERFCDAEPLFASGRFLPFIEEKGFSLLVFVLPLSNNRACVFATKSLNQSQEGVMTNVISRSPGCPKFLLVGSVNRHVLTSLHNKTPSRCNPQLPPRAHHLPVGPQQPNKRSR